MNKNDLVSVVADRANMSKSESAKTVDAVFDSITDVLKDGGDVRLVGFGTFAGMDGPSMLMAVGGAVAIILLKSIATK